MCVFATGLSKICKVLVVVVAVCRSRHGFLTAAQCFTKEFPGSVSGILAGGQFRGWGHGHGFCGVTSRNIRGILWGQQ